MRRERQNNSFFQQSTDFFLQYLASNIARSSIDPRSVRFSFFDAGGSLFSRPHLRIPRMQEPIATPDITNQHNVRQENWIVSTWRWSLDYFLQCLTAMVSRLPVDQNLIPVIDNDELDRRGQLLMPFLFARLMEQLPEMEMDEIINHPKLRCILGA